MSSSLDFFKTEKLWVFVGDVISAVGFRPFWLMLPGPGHQPQEGIF